MTSVSLRCTYRHRGYSSDEFDRLEQDLSGVATLHRRPQGYPEAGGVHDLALVAQYLQQLLLDEFVTESLKALGVALYVFYKRKKAESVGGFPPEIQVFELRFSDVDLRLHGKDVNNMECNFLSETAFQYLSEIVTAIKQHLDSEPLASTDKMVIDVFEPEVSLDEGGSPSFDFRHPWRITGIDIMGPNAYHPNERRLSDDHVRID